MTKLVAVRRHLIKPHAKAHRVLQCVPKTEGMI